MNQKRLSEVFDMFTTNGDFINAEPFGSGHINDTYLVTSSTHKYVLQKVNHNIFPEVEKMNQNIVKALKQFYKNQRAGRENRFKNLEIIFCKNGKNHFKDNNGNFWRLMNFVSDSISFDVVEKPETALEAAKAYGYFQKNLIDVDPDDFFPVIEDFHNLEMRLNSFKNALNNNPENRNETAFAEIEFVKSHEHLSTKLNALLENNQIPIRLTHNDTKINNVLFDKETLKGIAVIDLDTIMPGTVLFDFGDMVRTFTSPAAEDEKDLTKVVLRLEVFEAMAKGYLSELRDELSASEIDNLVFGGKIMTFMIGLRFLTDYLEGDIYYKTTYNNHNLVRSRTQFKLLREIESKEVILNQIIRDLT